MSELGKTLIDFSINGSFPDETISAAQVEGNTLAGALVALQDAKGELEREIRHISRENAPDVDTWISHAQTLQDDIEKSRRLASNIVRQAKQDEERDDLFKEKESYTQFLTKETEFNDQLLAALHSLQHVNDSLNQADLLIQERKILDTLRMLEDTWSIMAKVPAQKDARAIQLLDARCFEIRDTAQKALRKAWNGLLDFSEEGRMTINGSLPDEPTDLREAITAMKAYKELDNAATSLWENFDRLILQPRTNPNTGSPPCIVINNNSIRCGTRSSDLSIKSLFADLEDVIRFLTEHLPTDILQPFSVQMMPKLSDRIKEKWLDTAVPVSLDDMTAFQKALAQVQNFATTIESLDWPGAESFHDWVADAPKIWLSKRRETSLDWTRNELSLGIRTPQYAERIETRMLDRDEGHDLASTNVADPEWDAAWDSEEEEGKSSLPESKNRSLDEHRVKSRVIDPVTPDEDDAADAWGWGEDEDEPVPATTQPAEENIAPASSETRQVTLSEKYWTSSMPQSVMRTVRQILEDGAELTRPENEHIPISPAAPSLFSLPTLILAMYRAVSPSYYNLHASGNMYLYNDSLWLVDQLADYSKMWKERDDLSSRAFGMVRLDGEIHVIESFGKRAYSKELNSQRTIINDLLGGAQNFLQSEDSLDSREQQEAIRTVISHIRSTAAGWNQILSYSAWASAIGSLVNAVANKLINDVFDMSGMSVDEAESTATILKMVEELDELFVRESPTNGSASTSPSPSLPLTPQFAPLWMKMKFLSEALQSNLKDIQWLWFESDLSLYFTVEEVCDLIGLSFENNAGVRKVLGEIQATPLPKEDSLGVKAGR